MTTAHALVSSEFFDKLISHPKSEEAYKFFSATGSQSLREDMRRAFPSPASSSRNTTAR